MGGKREDHRNADDAKILLRIGKDFFFDIQKMQDRLAENDGSRKENRGNDQRQEDVGVDGALELFIILGAKEIGGIDRKSVSVTDKDRINDVEKGGCGTRCRKSFGTEKESRDRRVDDTERRGQKRREYDRN